MRISRRAFLLTAAAAAVQCSRLYPLSPLQKAASYLWTQQAGDGGFHSSTYGLLRSGQSLTPFVLDALMQVPVNVLPPPAGAVDRALAFIRNNTNQDGALGMMSEAAADYPNYATSLAVSVFAKVRAASWQQDIAPMVSHLRARQFTEANGWKPEDAPYGGWGMGGPIHRPPEAGHVDLSMTRFVLEALRASGVPPSDPAITSALAYLKRSQNSDGGFYFSAVNPEINKAGEAASGFASYGTATADGVLALRAAGISETDSRIVKALEWLKANHRPDRASGFDAPVQSERKAWATGLRFYYAHAIARALPELPIELPTQENDGSFRNSDSLVKEDDPLIATTFAIHVLAR